MFAGVFDDSTKADETTNILNGVSVILLATLLVYCFIQLETYFTGQATMMIAGFVLFSSLLLSLKFFPLPVSLLICFAALLDYGIGAIAYDFSSDGNTYHYKAIHILSTDGNLFDLKHDIRLPGTPLFQWIFPALHRSVSELIHVNSSGKLFLGSVLSLVAFSIVRPNKGIKEYIIATTFALVVAFPPIFWAQIFTGYGDYWTYWSLALTTLSLLAFIRANDPNSQKHFLILTFIGFCFSSVIKYQSAYLGSFLFTFAIVVVFRLRLFPVLKEAVVEFKWRAIFAALTTFFVLLITILKNFQLFGHIVPVLTHAEPGQIFFDNEFYRHTQQSLHFLYSWFSSVEVNTDSPKLGIFQISALDDLLKYGKPDVRFGAGGPLFGALIVLSICAILSSDKRVWIFVILIFCGYTQLPGVGTMRYYPVIQLLPILALLLGTNLRLKKWLLTLIIVNVVIVAVGSVVMQTYLTVSQKHLIDYLKATTSHTYCFEDGDYFYNFVTLGELSEKVDPSCQTNVTCQDIRTVVPFSPRPGLLCRQS